MEEKQVNYFHIDILNLVNSKRLLHGIRQDDYERYFSYCKNRLMRLRSGLKIYKKSKNAYLKASLTPEMVTESKILNIPLFCAERCWAFYNKVKNTKNKNSENPDSISPKKQRFMHKKLKKCLKFASQLLELVEKTQCDFTTKLEAKAYNANINLLYYISLNNLKDAISYAIFAKKIYEKLSRFVVSGIRKEYIQKVEELTDLEKICLYNLSSTISAADHQKMAAKIDSELEKIQPTTSKLQVVFEWYPNTFYAPNQFIYDICMEFQKIESGLKFSSDFGKDQCGGNKDKIGLKITRNLFLKITQAISEMNKIITEKIMPSEDINMCDIQETQLSLFIMKYKINLYFCYIHVHKIIRKTTIDNLKIFHCSRLLRIINKMVSSCGKIINIYSDLEKPNILYQEYQKILECLRYFYGALVFKIQGSQKSSIHLLYKSLIFFNQISKEFMEKKNDYLFNLARTNSDHARVLKIDLDLEYFEEKKPKISKTCVVANLHEKDFDWHDSALITIPCPMIPIPCPPEIDDKAFGLIKWPEINKIPAENVEDEFHDPESRQQQSITDRFKSWIWG